MGSVAARNWRCVAVHCRKIGRAAVTAARPQGSPNRSRLGRAGSGESSVEKDRAQMRRLRRATAAGEEGTETTEARRLRENRPQMGRPIGMIVSGENRPKNCLNL